MVEIKNISKSYGGHQVLKNVSFTINKGEIVGFLGPNGAGKSTTMNIITGYIATSEGTVTIDGHDIVSEPKQAKKSIGYLPENPPLYMEMKVIEYLKFVYELKNVKMDDMNEHIHEVMILVDIEDVKNRVIKNLSKGYKQRVGLAQALIGSPEVLILDEPTVGLDPNQIIEIRNVIRGLGKEHTIILSTHILSEVSEVCDRVIIINNGTIVAEDTPQNLSKNMTRGNSVVARVEGEEEKIIEVIGSIAGVVSVESQGVKEEGSYDILVEVESGIDIRKDLSHTLVMNNMTVLMLKDVVISLEDIFAQLTADEANAQVGQQGDGEEMFEKGFAEDDFSEGDDEPEDKLDEDIQEEIEEETVLVTDGIKEEEEGENNESGI